MSSSSAQSRLLQIAGHVIDGNGEGGLPPVPTVAGDSVGPSPSPHNPTTSKTKPSKRIGIGRATALQYARNNLKALFICDFTNTNLPALESELHTLAPNVITHARTFDAADEASVAVVVQEALDKYARLDIFFANAGVLGGMKLVGDITVEEFVETLRINTLSVFLAVKHAGKAMQAVGGEKKVSGGSIIATASTAGVRSGAGTTDYSASKAAVISIIQTSAFQLAGTNVRCNAICPGLTETGMTSGVWDTARKRGTEGKIGQLNPLKRGAVSDEIARVALFLGSDESSYVNAQFWLVDGGLSGSHPTAPGKIF
ncbi:NAD(P)-binding protein [Tuber magnatum]|uniref:NAD(P)-binding protein n=1 Tax=Tuber magnatum TaxID=42249 RepID=A0A317STS2_9PEZI|nr:NAD(P)-binding protein [Tuber magnatum]